MSILALLFNLLPVAAFADPASIPLKSGERWRIDGTDVGREVTCNLGSDGGGGSPDRPPRKPGVNGQVLPNEGFSRVKDLVYSIQGDRDYPLAIDDDTVSGICRKMKLSRAIDFKFKILTGEPPARAVVVLSSKGEFLGIDQSSRVFSAAVDYVDCKR